MVFLGDVVDADEWRDERAIHHEDEGEGCRCDEGEEPAFDEGDDV